MIVISNKRNIHSFLSVKLGTIYDLVKISANVCFLFGFFSLQHIYDNGKTVKSDLIFNSTGKILAFVIKIYRLKVLNANFFVAIGNFVKANKAARYIIKRLR